MSNTGVRLKLLLFIVVTIKIADTIEVSKIGYCNTTWV